MALIEKYNEDGQLSVYFSTEGEKEHDALAKMIALEIQNCPACGKNFEVKPNTDKIKVHDPMAPSLLGMDLGEFRCNCAHCGAYCKGNDQMVLEAFPSVIKILKLMRAGVSVPVIPRNAETTEDYRRPEEMPKPKPTPPEPAPQPRPTPTKTPVVQKQAPIAKPLTKAQQAVRQAQVRRGVATRTSNPYFGNRKDGTGG